MYVYTHTNREKDVSITVYKNLWRQVLFLRTTDWLIWGFELVEYCNEEKNAAIKKKV